MFQHWTNRRKASLVIHSVVVLIPLTFSTVAALFFWQWLFQSWLIAGALVSVIDALSLLGLALFILRVASPFQRLRHVLPFVSIVPLGYEMWFMLAAHNDALLSIGVALIVTAILVAVAQRCYVTIERLFVDPTEAAEELVAEQMSQVTRAMHMRVTQLSVTLDAHRAMGRAAARAIEEWTDAQRVIVARQEVPQLVQELAPDEIPVDLLFNLDTMSDADRLDLARTLRRQGDSWRAVARTVRIPEATLRRKLALEEVS